MRGDPSLPLEEVYLHDDRAGARLLGGQALCEHDLELFLSGWQHQLEQRHRRGVETSEIISEHARGGPHVNDGG